MCVCVCNFPFFIFCMLFIYMYISSIWRNKNSNQNINSSSKLACYSMFKLNFEFESYVSNDTLWKTLTRFRISSHSLAIEYGRIQGIPRYERLCLCCNQNLVETEFHFILICSKYNDIPIPIKLSLAKCN